jgi:Mlc titration factor MtfA (ptsG expression regulator)
MNIIRRYITRRTLLRYKIPFYLWHQTSQQLPLIKQRSNSQRTRIRLLATLFLQQKTISAAADLQLNDSMRLCIAIQACLMIVKLGLDSYKGWREIIVYPKHFMVRRKFSDENGLVHSDKQALSGESWQRGPVILSWEDVQQDSFQLNPGRHVVIHEFAHKLDMLSGRANGMPPLHPDMSLEAWSASLSSAYQHLCGALEHHQHTHINPYAATNPAEFFAVISELYFTAPATLKKHHDKVYQQLKQYYRIEL